MNNNNFMCISDASDFVLQYVIAVCWRMLMMDASKDQVLPLSNITIIMYKPTQGYDASLLIPMCSWWKSTSSSLFTCSLCIGVEWRYQPTTATTLAIMAPQPPTLEPNRTLIKSSTPKQVISLKLYHDSCILSTPTPLSLVGNDNVFIICNGYGPISFVQSD